MIDDMKLRNMSPATQGAYVRAVCSLSAFSVRSSGNSPGIRGLDVGAVPAFPWSNRDVHGPSSHFTGIDVWIDALERARVKLELHGLTNVDIVETDVASMPFPNAHFDLVVSNIGINNFPDPRAALQECRRVAKTGARLVLTTNAQGHFAALYALLDTILDESGLEPARDALRREAQHRPSKHAITNLLVETRFTVSRCFEQSFRIRFLDGSAMLRHSLVKWFLDGPIGFNTCSWRGAFPFQTPEFVTIPALRSSVENAAPRPGNAEIHAR